MDRIWVRGSVRVKVRVNHTLGTWRTRASLLQRRGWDLSPEGHSKGGPRSLDLCPAVANLTALPYVCLHTCDSTLAFLYLAGVEKYRGGVRPLVWSFQEEMRPRTKKLAEAKP